MSIGKREKRKGVKARLGWLVQWIESYSLLLLGLMMVVALIVLLLWNPVRSQG